MPAQQQSQENSGDVPQLAPAEMLRVDRALRCHQLAVELIERQAGRQHRMLDVEQAVVARREPPFVGDPALGPRIGGIDADIDDVRHFQTPLADDPKPLMVPVRVGNQVDRDINAERAGEFDRFEIAVDRDALAEFAQPLLVDRLETEKHGFEPEPLPQAEDVLVAQQHVAARLEVIPLADAGPDDRLPDLHSVPLVDKGDVVDDENSRLADRLQILAASLRAHQPIAAAIESPCAAKRTIPTTTAREFDRSARIERAEKIFPPM